jgi:hypothetical protein
MQDADRLLIAGRSLGGVFQVLKNAEATYHRWRNQYGGRILVSPSRKRAAVTHLEERLLVSQRVACQVREL